MPLQPPNGQTAYMASPRGKLSAKRTDGGLLCRHNPLVDNIRKATPHPAFGRLPLRGKAFLLLTPLL